jgi:hypothetical protein
MKAKPNCHEPAAGVGEVDPTSLGSSALIPGNREKSATLRSAVARGHTSALQPRFEHRTIPGRDTGACEPAIPIRHTAQVDRPETEMRRATLPLLVGKVKRAFQGRLPPAAELQPPRTHRCSAEQCKGPLLRPGAWKLPRQLLRDMDRTAWRGAEECWCPAASQLAPQSILIDGVPAYVKNVFGRIRIRMRTNQAEQCLKSTLTLTRIGLSRHCPVEERNDKLIHGGANCRGSFGKAFIRVGRN